jgi:hypothetical protein
MSAVTAPHDETRINSHASADEPASTAAQCDCANLPKTRQFLKPT